MKKALIGLLVLGTLLMAKVTNIPVTEEFVTSNKMKIIDIRTEAEWKQMGIIKDAHLMTFFNEKSEYNIKDFLKELNKIVKKDEQFAIVCNASSRTKLVSNFLGKKLDYDVVNLVGGMKKLIKEGYQVAAYDDSNSSSTSKEEISSSLEENNATKVKE